MSGDSKISGELIQTRPAIAGLLALLAVACVVGVSGVVWQWQKAEAAREVAFIEKENARRLMKS